MKKLLIILCMVVLVAAPVASFAKKKSEIPQTTIEGLVLVPDTTGIAMVWAEPGADLSQYNRVYLVRPWAQALREGLDESRSATPQE
jgi:hypothetical protein